MATDAPAHAGPAEVVSITFSELHSDSPAVLDKIHRGFGQAGLGIVTVSGVPELPRLRRELLLLADRFAALPEAVRQRYSDPLGGQAVVGWSRGAEALEGGQPDDNKGSFYANPLHDCVPADLHAQQQFPSYTTPNVWPREELPALEPAFKALGRLVRDVGLALAGQCDRYAARRRPGAPPGRLRASVADSPNPKGRLLHYFPPAERSGAAEAEPRLWCAEHTDHGSLTGLLPALYTREGCEVPCPDAAAGLHIRDRSGAAVRVALPADNLAFQMGEAMQVQSGGLLRATPHFVRAAAGPAAAGVARNTFAVFLQPKWDAPMDLPPGADAAAVGIGLWRPGISFGEFSELTVQRHCAAPPAASSAA